MDYGLRGLWEAIAGIRARLGKQLQGRHVSSEAPSDKDLWVWNDSDKKWEPSGSAQVLFSRCTSNLDPLTNSFQSITGDGDSSKVRLLLPTIGDWLVEATASFKREAGDPGVMSAGLFVDDSGTREDGDARFVGAANLDEGTVGQRWKVTTTAANTPIELKAASANSSDALIRTEHTVLAACIGAGGGSVAAASDHGNLDGLGDTSDHAWALLVDGTRAMTGNLVIPDAGYIGSASDTDAMQIEADGDIVMTQDLAITGALSAGATTLSGNLIIPNNGYIGSVGDTDAILIGATGDVALTQSLGVVGVVGCGELTITDGASLNLQEAITFTGATTENIIEFPDNLADALSFEEGGTVYLQFVTTDAGEKVVFGKNIDVTGNIVVSGTVDGVDIAAWIDQDVSSGSAPTFAQAITDNHVVTIDGTANDTEHAVFNAAGLEGLTDTELLDGLSGDASAAFDWNGQDLANIGVAFLTEQAAAEADVAGKGQIWVKTGAPNTLWFTNEDGTDAQLGVGGTFTNYSSIWALGGT